MLFWNSCFLANQGHDYLFIGKSRTILLANTRVMKYKLWNILKSMTNLVRLRFQLQIPKANVVATNFHQITVTNLTSLRKTNNWCLFEEIWFQKVQRAIPGKSQRASNWAGKAIILFRYNISYTCYLHH